MIEKKINLLIRKSNSSRTTTVLICIPIENLSKITKMIKFLGKILGEEGVQLLERIMKKVIIMRIKVQSLMIC